MFTKSMESPMKPKSIFFQNANMTQNFVVRMVCADVEKEAQMEDEKAE